MADSDPRQYTGSARILHRSLHDRKYSDSGYLADRIFIEILVYITPIFHLSLPTHDSGVLITAQCDTGLKVCLMKLLMGSEVDLKS